MHLTTAVPGKVYCTTSLGYNLVARCDQPVPPRKGETVYFAYDPDKVVFFDAETGARLRM